MIDSEMSGSVQGTASDWTGLLIIRTWIEAGSSEPLRAHIRIVKNTSDRVERTLTVSRPEDVGAMVERWLADILGEADPVEPPK